METRDKPFDVGRSFGMGVLLKLTKKNVKGIEISTDGERYSSNVSLNELSQAVNTLLETHHIKLKVK